MNAVIKNTVIGMAAALLLLPASPCPADDGGREHVDAVIEKQRQKAEEAKANEGLLTLKAITSIFQEEQSRTHGAVSANMFENPERDEVLQSFRKFLLRQPVKIQGGATLAPGEEANRDQIVQLYAIMKAIQEELHPPMRRVLQMAIVGEFAKRLNKLEKTHDYVDDFFPESFRSFDNAFHQFMQDVDTVKANGVTDVSGKELLMSSGLGEFATDGMKTQPRFDKILRALDNHLISAGTDVLNKLWEDNEALYKLHEQNMKAYERTRDIIAQSPSADRAAGIMENYAVIISQVEKLHLRIRTLIQDAEGDTVMGRVRKADKSLAPHGAFQADSGTVRNGCPVYARRVRRAIEECKFHYLDTVKAMNAANRGKPGYKPIPEVWN
jgi:hypothetical protein